jgi:hypothetical protein
VVCAVGRGLVRAENAGVPFREEATMPRTTNRLADLMEDAAIIVVFFSGVVLVAALVAAFVV